MNLSTALRHVTAASRLALGAIALGALGCAPASPAAAPASVTASSPDPLDVTVAAPEHYKVRLDNAHVRVVECVLGPGEKDAKHTHAAGWYYVTKPGTMRVVHDDGKSETWEAKAGEAAWMAAEGPHTSENVGKEPMGFVLVEVKSAKTK